ncbi:Protein brambleberry [Triplophysa tibetana]|uniref:Protein brambleberry n=1 Tax=Triplophysa tibetana TaxID=1572043 RepID=A0A5A9PQH7_9TELE|nr:Protein brambleberry [Triplophysa tibetana]
MGFWLLMLWVSSMQYGQVDAFFDWLKKAEPAPAPKQPVAPVLTQGDVPAFEMSVADEKFLAEAKQMELSPLDSCHFQVVAQLKAICSGLSEEQLAKLGVALFNCQSEVEGRRTYPCTEEMTIKECTADMDSDTWNAYHIVSNRARSVCYATRQQHFRRRAELTVNALISTATSQLDAMNDLKEGQKELREMTAASLDKLLEGHGTLQLQQHLLKEGQDQLDSSISDNLQRLAQEKALISTGQQLVAQLIHGIAQRMENVSGQLKDQASDVEEGHQAILSDLAVVRGNAQDIFQKMELNLKGFLQHQNITSQFYSELIHKLERMNGTLGYMLMYLDNMQNRLEDRLHIIQGYLGWAGLSLRALWTCTMHAGYFLLSAVLLSFLQCATFSRISLLFTVPVNAIAEINQQSSLDLVSLTLLLFTLSLGRWVLLQVMWSLSKIKGQACSSTPLSLGPPTEKTPDRGCLSNKPCPASSFTPVQNDLDCDLEVESFMMAHPCILAPPPACSPPNFSHHNLGTPNHSTPRLKNRHSIGLVLENVPQRNLGGLMNQSRRSSPNHSLASNGSFSGRPLCSGTTRLGQPCKNKALVGQDFCRIHEGGHTSYSRL